MKKEKQASWQNVEYLIEHKYNRTADNIARLSSSEQVRLREQQEKEAAEMQAIFPVGKTYFAYARYSDADPYTIVNELPPLVVVDQLVALRLTAGLIAGMQVDGVHGRSMVIVAMHHGSRVVEFTFDLVVDKIGNTKLYEPFM